MSLRAVSTTTDGFSVTLYCFNLTVVRSVSHPKLCHTVVTANYQGTRDFFLETMIVNVHEI